MKKYRDSLEEMDFEEDNSFNNKQKLQEEYNRKQLTKKKRDKDKDRKWEGWN